jgi:amino acid permease
MMVISIVMLIAATRTMKKLAAASGDYVHQSFGLKTINLNLLAAILQFAAFIVWSGGFICIRYLKQTKTIEETNEEVYYKMMVSCVSSVILLFSYYLIIRVFWYYGINVEQTLIKREKMEEEKRRQTEE